MLLNKKVRDELLYAEEKKKEGDGAADKLEDKPVVPSVVTH
jgi:hypothetical protein